MEEKLFLSSLFEPLTM